MPQDKDVLSSKEEDDVQPKDIVFDVSSKMVKLSIYIIPRPTPRETASATILHRLPRSRKYTTGFVVTLDQVRHNS